MRNRLLTEVPDHIVYRPTEIRTGMKWQSDYNVAAWFRFRAIDSEPLSLFVQWIDELGEHRTFVDRGTITASSLLLSGVARLKITGMLRQVSVYIETMNETYSVDELFVQPALAQNQSLQA